MNALQALSLLFRTPLSLVVALSALTGYLLIERTCTWAAAAVFFGVGLLSACASGLNQCQEFKSDALMDRTKKRPLPLGTLKVYQAAAASIITGGAGMFLLYFGAGPASAFLGLCAVLWYNAVYTPLKCVTPFAVIVGACTGALAPLIGCAAAQFPIQGKSFCLALFLFLWQVPHFLTALLKYEADYAQAGFPILSKKVDTATIRTILIVWILSTSSCTLLFPLFGIIRGFTCNVALIIINIVYGVWIVRNVARLDTVDLPRPFSRSLYAFQACTLALVFIGAIID